ncbi:hypothetical protein E2C01_088027 [Portunus trituberculatus]|uniref:Uncharacterized protein n=1 Tax=Portunus trituberculatus TaxID=210409 RepID=A0A5B7JEA0_PORTR|nr:hypothetical protein [Portunus trituberculatus]
MHLSIEVVNKHLLHFLLPLNQYFSYTTKTNNKILIKILENRRNTPNTVNSPHETISEQPPHYTVTKTCPQGTSEAQAGLSEDEMQQWSSDTLPPGHYEAVRNVMSNFRETRDMDRRGGGKGTR